MPTADVMDMVRKNMLIRRAATGDLASLKSLHQYIERKRDSDSEICGHLIHLLDPTDIPSDGDVDSFEEAFRDKMERVALALNIFFSVFNSTSAEDASSKQTLATLFGEHLAEIFQWVLLFSTQGVHLPTCALIIIMLQSLDESLLLRIMTLRRLLELVLSIWIRKNRLGGRYIVATTHRICPILDMVQGLVSHEPRKAAFLQLLEDEPRRVREIAHAIRVRILELGESYTEGDIGRHFALEQILEILAISGVVLSRYDRWLAFLVPKDSPNFLGVVVEVLVTISRGAVEESYLATLVRTIRRVCTLALRAGSNACPPLKKLLTILDGGILTLITRCLLHLPPTNPAHVFAADIFQEIAAYGIFHEVARFFAAGPGVWVAPADLRRANQLSARDINQECWEVVRTFVVQIIQKYNRNMDHILTTNICDGLGHTHHRWQEAAGSDVRQCSRCHSVVYCSQQCQRNDWGQYHRYECSTQLAQYSLRRLSGWISPVNRAWCLFLVEGIVNAHMSSFDEKRLIKGITAPLHSCILVIEGLSLPTRISVTKVSDYMRRNKDLPDTSLAKRIDAYLAQFLQYPGTIWLVEALFPYGGATIHYLIRMTRDEDGCLHAVSAVTRVCDCANRRTEYCVHDGHYKPGF
ncbi:hypothetical protein MD484_g8271, partial [Candolleomyces efflorescens]